MNSLRIVILSAVLLSITLPVCAADEFEAQLPEITDREEGIREQVEFAQENAAEAQQKTRDARKRAEIRRNAVSPMWGMDMMGGAGTGGSGFAISAGHDKTYGEGGSLIGLRVTPHTGFHGPARNNDFILIPSAPMQPKHYDQLQEDMQIMSEVIREKVDPRPAGKHTLLTIGREIMGGGDIPDGLYVGDYGLLFFQRVSFPLRPEGFEAMDDQPARPEQTEPVDPVWDQARRRLHGQPVEPAGHDRKIVYDPKKVEELKERLIDCFRHASNIRNLTPDEWIVIRASFVPHQSGMTRFVKPFIEEYDMGYFEEYMQEEIEEEVQLMPSFLILRAQKKDVDRFADEKISLEEFKSRVSVINF